MERMPFKVPLEGEVGTLAAGERQKTEIIKQLYLQRRFLVLDEPTSVLTPQEAAEMLGLVRDLAHSGALTIVIITHKLKEVAAFVDEVTVLRRGRMAGTGAVRDLGPADLTAMMIGEPHAPENPERQGAPIRRNPAGGVRTCAPPRTAAARASTIATMKVHAHEIVGIAGVSGNGQKDLVEVLGGQRPAESGEIIVDGDAYDASRAAVAGARRARAAGGAAAQRLRAADDGGGQPRICAASIAVPKKSRRGWLDRAGMAARAQHMIAAYGIRTPSPRRRSACCPAATCSAACWRANWTATCGC